MPRLDTTVGKVIYFRSLFNKPNLGLGSCYVNFVKEANETLSYIYAASIFVLSTSILCCLLNEDFRFIKPKPLYVLEMLFKLKIV